MRASAPKDAPMPIPALAPEDNPSLDAYGVVDADGVVEIVFGGDDWLIGDVDVEAARLELEDLGVAVGIGSPNTLAIV